MAPWIEIEGIAAPLGIPNVNTDDIWPGPAASPVLRKLTFGSGMGPEDAGLNAFAAWRLRADGAPNPDFILNQPPFDKARIILGGVNFGCGSSRELAVWALTGIGISCVIAPSFGDIFYDNCIKNGILPARVTLPALTHLLQFVADSAHRVLRINLESCQIQAGDALFAFEISDYSRRLMLDGVDEITAALADMSTLDKFEQAYAARHSWLTTGSR